MTRDLSVKLGKLTLPNPVCAASGTFCFEESFLSLAKAKSLGAVVTKTITRMPSEGNPSPRTCETAAGMLNAIGLENKGVEDFITNTLPRAEKLGPGLIVSISAQTLEDFAYLAKVLSKKRSVRAIELNLSCPNIHYRTKSRGGLAGEELSILAQDARLVRTVVKRVRSETSKTLIAKLSPNVTDIVSIAKAALDGGADALGLINTLSGMAIDISTRMSRLGRPTGGLSGPAIKPVALRMVWEVYRKTRASIIASGGIMNTEDAIEFLLAGASAVCVGTAQFRDPAAGSRIIGGLRKYCVAHSIGRLRSLIGAARVEK